MYNSEREKHDETFKEILRKLEENHKSKIKRIPRTAEQDGDFLFTVILENYVMLEVAVNAISVFGTPIVEIEVDVY